MFSMQSITSQWAETGNLSKTNWLDVGKCSLLGRAKEIVTGFIGAGMGAIIASKLIGVAVTAPLVSSNSTITRWQLVLPLEVCRKNTMNGFVAGSI